MGNFYVNYVLRGPAQEAVGAALAGRTAMVTPRQNGCVVAFDQESDEQDEAVIAELAARLSGQLQCPVLALLNHDDDVLRYWLYENGSPIDQYNSSPTYFDPAAGRSAPAGGDASKLCAAFGAADVAGVDAILRRSTLSGDGYTFELQRHAELMQALGVPVFGVGTSYASLENGEYPEGLSSEDVVGTL